MPQDAFPADRRPEEPARLPLAAFVFVILALVALAATPALLLHRISGTTAEIGSTLLPAYDRLRDLALAMEERISSSRSTLIVGDGRYDARLARAKADEAAALRAIETLAPRLGPRASGRVAALRRHMAWRDSLEAAVTRAGGGAETYRAALPGFDAAHDSILAELAGLDQELVALTEARAREEEEWAGTQRTLSIALGTVALFAALLVGWFALGQRQLRREVQEALDEANREHALSERRREALERASESRVRLLRGITHDVKNPLGAAKGYAELLQMGVKAPMAPEQAPLLAGIQRSVDGALAIIGDLLDLARADSGGLPVHPVDIDLAAVVRAAAADHRPAAEAAGHALETRLPDGPLRVHTDPARVGQVLGNLLSNAIKYTPPPGRITVHCAVEEGDGGRWALVRVRDTGPGIPPEQREAVFDEFTRLDDGGAKKGHGLGLAIARRIARLLGGELGLADEPGGGALFVLRLPIGPGADGEGGGAAGQPSARRDAARQAK